MPHEEGDMNTPVSPVSVHSTTHPEEQLTQFLARKRSHSQMSQDALVDQDHHHHHHHHHHHNHEHMLPSRQASIDPMPVDSPSQAEDYASPRGSRSFKRGDAPKNGDGKYVCEFATECVGLTFDRKCEWSKHMDKHDRPYRCPDPDCAKLQGFTYSGGLLRHEREVHGKHGGPKAQLMCPYTDCKRHTGKGFTRKENLNEHVRRVHESKATHNSNQAGILRRDLSEVVPGPEEYIETPVARVFDENILPEELAASVIGKRRHSEIDGFPPPLPPHSDDMEQLQQENKRLRADNFEKDDRIRSMEMAAEQSREEVLRLQEMLHQLQQHLPLGQQSQSIVG